MSRTKAIQKAMDGTPLREGRYISPKVEAHTKHTAKKFAKGVQKSVSKYGRKVLSEKAQEYLMD